MKYGKNFRMTAKEVKESFNRVYRVGYCDLQFLLNYQRPIGYTCGVYGWNCDVFDFGDFAITTGYRPIGEDLPKSFTEPYENRADYEYSTSGILGDRQQKIEAILAEFVEAVRKRA